MKDMMDEEEYSRYQSVKTPRIIMDETETHAMLGRTFHWLGLQKACCAMPPVNMYASCDHHIRLLMTIPMDMCG